MIKVLLLSIVLLLVAMVFMSVNILFRVKGKFPEYRVGHNRDMKKLGISCVRHEELTCHREFNKKGCSTCEISEAS